MTGHPSTSHSADGVLVVGHGTTDPRGQAEFFAAAARISALLEPGPAAAGFLELAKPAAFEAAGRIVERGARSVTILPLLLFAAGHARRDLPRLAEQLSAAHPTVRFSVASVLRFQRDLLALSALRFEEALAQRESVPREQTHLVLVGRGSSDTQATADLHELAARRQSSTPVGEVTTCFLAMARPTLDEALEQAARSPRKRVVVQPHLLFQGNLSTTVKAAVGRSRASWPEKEWILAEPLGDHALLASAALEAAGLATKNPVPPANASNGDLPIREAAAATNLGRQADLASLRLSG